MRRISGSNVVTSNSMMALAVCFHLIDGIVHRGDQALNVGAVERRDKGRAKPEQHVARDGVGFVLELQDLLEAKLDLIAAGEHVAQRPGAVDNHRRMPLKQGVELRLARHQFVKPSQHAVSPFCLVRCRLKAMPGNPPSGQGAKVTSQAGKASGSQVSSPALGSDPVRRRPRCTALRSSRRGILHRGCSALRSTRSPSCGRR